MVNLPDGMASALVKTAEYRNPRPGTLEEWLFYTHLCGKTGGRRWSGRPSNPG